MKIREDLLPVDLSKKVERFWQLSGEKIRLINNNYDESEGSPVFTVRGNYTTRGWTEWTQGFQYGSPILQFDASGEPEFLEIGAHKTLAKMASHVSHIGVHDHGFNNISTYGNLLRLMLEGKTAFNEWEKQFYEMALKVSGAVQASRWTPIKDGGFIYSFNGPHSLFVDTIRSCRVLTVSHQLGHQLMGENDRHIDLLERALQHAVSTAAYSVYYGEGRDAFDIRGRVAHESIFNTNDGNYRSPNAQQGYSGFSTWTRGLSWAITGFAELLEFLDILPDKAQPRVGDRKNLENTFIRAARATCDFYIAHTPTDGIPYWDTGAPNLHKLGDYLNKPADPFNEHEPVDSSAAAIAAQGLLRFGRYLKNKGQEEGNTYWQAGLTVMDTLLDEPYLSTDPAHQGLILHAIYHQPNGWDYVPEGSKIPRGESCMWGDYHAREAALYLKRIIEEAPYYTYFGCVKQPV